MTTCITCRQLNKRETFILIGTIVIATWTVSSGWEVVMSDGSDINTACLLVSKVITVMGLIW